ncbi:uncharacterized protein cubi_03762 [Cryptosporidium ubiquitum]|uniref:Uncharacterized protein n=1 Tax=Cryptosporidium ubiquitum TaxID=857276 RepID=A0A1J4MPA9_9CRYT|nr:uncharacterized protein cubi_03762 [Cryptosporidium ubiquitum]OII75283.1 hypothetical protein cubi_03762 [Cryptosporidium ubiquitum]
MCEIQFLFILFISINVFLQLVLLEGNNHLNQSFEFSIIRLRSSTGCGFKSLLCLGSSRNRKSGSSSSRNDEVEGKSRNGRSPPSSSLQSPSQSPPSSPFQSQSAFGSYASFPPEDPNSIYVNMLRTQPPFPLFPFTKTDSGCKSNKKSSDSEHNDEVDGDSEVDSVSEDDGDSEDSSGSDNDYQDMSSLGAAYVQRPLSVYDNVPETRGLQSTNSLYENVPGENSVTNHGNHAEPQGKPPLPPNWRERALAASQKKNQACHRSHHNSHRRRHHRRHRHHHHHHHHHHGPRQEDKYDSPPPKPFLPSGFRLNRY